MCVLKPQGFSNFWLVLIAIHIFSHVWLCLFAFKVCTEVAVLLECVARAVCHFASQPSQGGALYFVATAQASHGSSNAASHLLRDQDSRLVFESV